MRIRLERRALLAALAALACLALVLTSTSPARAQARTLYLDRLFMAGAPDDAIGLWRPHMGEKTRFFGQIGLGFGLNPFRVEHHIEDEAQAALLGSETGAPVKAQLIGYLDAGVEISDRFAFQVGLPIIAFQGTNPTTSATVDRESSVSATGAAVMDMRFDLRAIVLRNDSRSFKLGAIASLWAPTGNALSWGGDKTASGGIGLAAEYDLKDFFVLLNTGLHFRPSLGVNDFRAGSELTWGAGVFVPLRDGNLRLGAEVFGSNGIHTGADGSNIPFEWMAEARIAMDSKKQGYIGAGGGTRLTAGYAPDFRVVGVAGYSLLIGDTDPGSPGKRFKADRYAEHGGDADKDGIPDDIDLCPTDPEDKKPPNTDDGCPALPDRDGDGIPDISDKCPDQPEDFDKIDDQDGCPEDDADKDGIADAKDACPKEPGEASPEPAKNGCPQFIRRISGSSEIQILKQVQFQTGSAKILQNSYPILDEVVRLLKVNPDIKHLDIEGHTDNRGSDELNERLSKDRARSCLEYLVNKGIDAGRLASDGYGPKRPIADNNTPDGRQKNRRVEFHIRNQSVGGGAPAP